MAPLTKKSVFSTVPAGLTLRHTLPGHDAVVLAVAWSPNGHALATGAQDGAVRLFDADRGRLRRMFATRSKVVTGIAWSPDGKSIATTAGMPTVKVWEAWTGTLRRTLKGHIDDTIAVAWSPTGKEIATGSDDHTVRIWDSDSGALALTYRGHQKAVWAVAWSSAGDTVASGSFDGAGHAWHAGSGTLLASSAGSIPILSAAFCQREFLAAFGTADGTIHLMPRTLRSLEGHTGEVGALSFSHDGKLLASKSLDGTVRIWRCDTWETVAVLDETASRVPTSIAFHPSENVLATTSDGETAVRIWEIDHASLLRSRAVPRSVHYTNAKVVLVGDTGVGKSALGLVLTGKKFELTPSSHGRRVWTLESKEVEVEDGRSERRETLLWDLAGQPGYRVFHRHHLNEVAVALVLFDSRSETDPFAGVTYWARALDEATRGFPLVKFLVAARIDRGGPPVSNERIADVCQRLGFQSVVETSARRGDGIASLGRAIRKSIAWDRMPRVSTPRVFYDMKGFVIDEKKAGRVLQRRQDLLERFLRTRSVDASAKEMFDTCLGRIEAAGLVKRLTFGDLTLLQPEMLDDYCAWLALAARAEPDGLGFVSEIDARAGNFRMDDDRPLRGDEQERLLITATVEDVVGRGIALRQPTEQGEMLVFPSELRSDMPDYPGSYVRAVTFLFEGPQKAIYATLAVCLAHAPAFTKERFFKNAALFKSAGGEICGFAIDDPGPLGEAIGRLTVFFDADANKTTKLTFLRYVNRQLQTMAFSGSVRRERVFQCRCGYVIPLEAIEIRRKNKETTAICPACGLRPPIDDLAEQSARTDESVEAQIEESDEERERQRRLLILPEREREQEHHVFLCHNSRDKPEVRKLAVLLREQGVLPWVDEESILAGDQIIPSLERVIDRSPSVAVCFGPHAMGKWQKQEYAVFLQRFVDHRAESSRRLRMIPVLLPSLGPGTPDLPGFLRGNNYIDLRKSGFDDRDAIRRLVKGILSDDSGG